MALPIQEIRNLISHDSIALISMEGGIRRALGVLRRDMLYGACDIVCFTVLQKIASNVKRLTSVWPIRRGKEAKIQRIKPEHSWSFHVLRVECLIEKGL